MDNSLKGLSFLRRHSAGLSRSQRVGLHILILLIIGFFGVFLFFNRNQGVKAGLEVSLEERSTFSEFSIIQGNSLLPIAPISNPEPEVIKRLPVVVTGYSSTEDQTDSDPFITAAGTLVREGVAATNILPFGTKIKLPELYGDRIFVVEDRMSKDRGYHIDIWFPSRWQALNFGAKRTYIEILES